MTRRDSSKRKHAECLCVAAKERRNQATLACLRHSTQIEGIGSQLEVLTKEITQFVTSINETLLCQKTRDMDKGEAKLKDEKTCNKTTNKDGIERASLPHCKDYFPVCQVHLEGSQSEV